MWPCAAGLRRRNTLRKAIVGADGKKKQEDGQWPQRASGLICEGQSAGLERIEGHELGVARDGARGLF